MRGAQIAVSESLVDLEPKGITIITHGFDDDVRKSLCEQGVWRLTHKHRFKVSSLSPICSLAFQLDDRHSRVPCLEVCSPI